jgi:hypothetical protein
VQRPALGAVFTARQERSGGHQTPEIDNFPTIIGQAINDFPFVMPDASKQILEAAIRSKSGAAKMFASAKAISGQRRSEVVMIIPSPFKSLINNTAICVVLSLPGQSQAVEFEAFSPTQTALVVTDGVIRTHLSPAGCDEGHELACSPVFQRSEFVSTESQSHGDKVIYSWDIMVPESFAYNASGGYLRAVRIINTSGESVFSFILDGDSGYSVGRKVCFSPESFGAWHTIQLHVAWDSTKRKGLKDETPGILRVFCDGVEVLSRSGRPNIGADEKVWFSFGLAGSLKLADGDNAEAIFRNVKIEGW